jgi:predicted GNAT family acetyltransferase
VESSLRWFDSSPSFLDAATEPLLDREAENTMVLGVGTDPRWPRGALGTGHRLGIVERGDAILGAIALSPTLLALSRMSDDAVTTVTRELATAGAPVNAAMGGRSEIAAFTHRWTPPAIAQHSGVFAADHALDPARPAAGELRVADESLGPLLLEWAVDFLESSPVPGQTMRPLIDGLIAARRLLVWFDGQPVCMGAGIAESPNGVRIGYVYTPSQFRGRGYASSWTTAATRHFLRTRRNCYLYADAANPTSTSIYRRAGYRQVGSAVTVSFAAGGDRSAGA